MTSLTSGQGTEVGSTMKGPKERSERYEDQVTSNAYKSGQVVSLEKLYGERTSGKARTVQISSPWFQLVKLGVAQCRGDPLRRYYRETENRFVLTLPGIPKAAVSITTSSPIGSQRTKSSTQFRRHRTPHFL